MAIKGRSKKKKVGSKGIVHIKATFNNTNITVTDEHVMSLLGLLLEKRVLEDLERIPRMQHL